MRYRTISFLSDYGTTDESVGVVKSIVRSIAPEASVLDITHAIPPFDIRTGALVLARSANYLVPGVAMAIVDPGAGRARRAVAVEVGDGESVLVGPDNGLLAPAVAIVGGAGRVVELTNAKYQLASVGRVAVGRDVFGPAAAHLCAGVPLMDLGDEIDADSLVPATLPFSELTGNVLSGDVIYVDHYGNLRLNIAPEQLEVFAGAMSVTVAGRTETVPSSYINGVPATGAAALVVDEVGLMALVLNQASAADRFGADIGATVTITGAV